MRYLARFPLISLSNSRSDAQHIMFMEIMGKYPPGMDEVMADDVPGETKAVLDLGCGSGSWYVALTLLSLCIPHFGFRIMEAARDFSHCTAVAVDLVPMQSMYVKSQSQTIETTDPRPSYMPPNLRYLSLHSFFLLAHPWI